ncbi:MAG: hypothetical protein WAU91_15975, partial [Desulfatitalea sp.]
MTQSIARLLPSNIKSLFHDRIMDRPVTVFLWIFLFIGLMVRLRSYLARISFWVDEAALANNLVERSLSQLIGPLDQNQVAPIGFCIIEKLLILLWGNHEYALRFLPFLAGSFALILTYVLVKQALGKSCALLCTAQLAVMKESIFYANNLKPYSLDLAIALGLVLLAWPARTLLQSKRQFWVLFLSGVAAVWFSFPALFVLAGIAMVFWYKAIKNQHWKTIVPLALISLAWVASFIIHYYLLRSGGEYDNLADAWSDRFVVLLPKTIKDIKHNSYLLYYVFRNPVWTIHPAVSIPIFLIGCALLWKNNRTFFFLILLPLVLNYFSSGLHAYPFRDRTLQYA